jgi:hypothetical protein
MTDAEYNDYLNICKSYDRPNFKGEDLFRGLFETNGDGRIIYIHSLDNRQFSFEVVFFIMNLMQNQWLRVTIKEMNETKINYENQLKQKTIEFDELIKELNVKSKRLDDRLTKLDKILTLLDK